MQSVQLVSAISSLVWLSYLILLTTTTTTTTTTPIDTRRKSHKLIGWNRKVRTAPVYEVCVGNQCHTLPFNWTLIVVTSPSHHQSSPSCQIKYWQHKYLGSTIFYFSFYLLFCSLYVSACLIVIAWSKSTFWTGPTTSPNSRTQLLIRPLSSLSSPHPLFLSVP